MKLSPAALEARARRAAKRVGLFVKKTRWRAGTTDNQGGFMLCDARTGAGLNGYRFDLEAEEVIALCTDLETGA